MNPSSDRLRRLFRGGASLALGALVLLGAAACSTPQTRAQKKSATFSALSKASQRLVLGGAVEAGMSQEAVFIAWGEPDSVDRQSAKSGETETWIYERQLTQFAPLGAYEDRLIARTGNVSRRAPGSGAGGFASGGPFTGRSFSHSGVRVLGYRYRTAEFVGGKLKAQREWRGAD